MMQESESLGNYLRREREMRGISVEQISYMTRIGIKLLKALEEDDHQALPAPPFVRGYLQAYAKYVKLDAQDLLLRYQHYLAMQPNRTFAQTKPHQFFSKERQQDRKRTLVILSGLVSILMVTGLLYFLKLGWHERRVRITAAAPMPKNLIAQKFEPEAAIQQPQPQLPRSAERATEPKEPKEAKKHAAPVPEAAVTPTAPAIPAPTSVPEVTKIETTTVSAPKPTAPTRKHYVLNLHSKEDVWIRFQSDSDKIKDMFLRKDNKITITANKVIKIFAGNVKNLDATLNGEALPSLVQGNNTRSIILPFSEIPNVPLPLFPPVENSALDKKSTAQQSDPQHENNTN